MLGTAGCNGLFGVADLDYSGTTGDTSATGGAGGDGSSVSTSTGSSSSGIGGAGASGSGGATGAGGAGGGSPACSEVNVTASIAECLDPAMPDAAFCDGLYQVGEMDITTNHFQTGAEFHVFLRFDLPPLDETVVTDLKVKLVVGDSNGAAGSEGGEMWVVEPFDAADLQQMTPMTLGVTAAASSPGAVSLNQTVEWTLPASAIAADGSLYLSLVPISSDGVIYLDAGSSAPPKVEVNCAD
jgi:hypothetical protein